MFTIKKDLIGIVLCGGESKRMKTDKALLEYHDDAQWKIVSKMLIPFCKEVVISINENQWKNWAKNEEGKFIIDAEKYKNHGPISGVLSVIEKYSNSGFFIVATDFPLLKSENLKQLFNERSEDFQTICFENDGFLQPLISIIEKESIIKLQEFFVKGNDSLRYFLEEIKTRRIKIDGENFLKNINTEEAFLDLKNKNDQRI
ncbi:molybdenum cofactor guanylyltransferase [Halpernia frigidisoli]|uniref:Probable molybdenum cofactor guanylyltransferase n=1 Tax=Halpernia frigidisoli TaxID=1125876 RepID=A0A1I3FSI0_9FLAO|nr:molybdenum cofactor guanylyltransferase [Halpernia frigidisoli]SFI13881.1 molybdopterin-guanine dinucleotide biosynthesis protein A [Halpernia frigidisoli]